jgi:hypothetical protein
MPLLRLNGGPEDGAQYPCDREPHLLLTGVPPGKDGQRPEHTIRAAYLRTPDGEYQFIGYKSAHEARLLYGREFDDAP